MNIYHQDDFVMTGSPVSSGESSRRSSNRFSDFKDFVRRRRNNGKNKNAHQQLPCSLPGEINQRKISLENQFFDFDDSDEERIRQSKVMRRRLSVPERELLNKDYAILKQSKERQFEVITAFDKHADPYKQYMQSLNCYDLAPKHGVTVLIDGELSMTKSLLALHQSGQDAAMVIDSVAQSFSGMLTVSDVLRAVAVASSTDTKIGDRRVRDFVRVHGKKKLISASVGMSVWDAARLFCLNHVHRIPVFQLDDSGKPADLVYTLSLRKIFYETIYKLVERRFSLAPHIKHRTLRECGIGVWDDVLTAPNDSKCGDIINMLMKRKLSCIPIVDERNKILGKVSKDDIMRELTSHTDDYLAIVDVPVKVVCQTPVYGSATNTVYEAICLLLATNDQCLFIVDRNQRVQAAVAFIDLMEYIINSSEIHQKMSA